MREPSVPRPAEDAGRGAIRATLASMAGAARRHPVILGFAVLVIVLLPVTHELSRGLGPEFVADAALVVVLVGALLLAEAAHELRQRRAQTSIDGSELRFRQMAEHGHDISFRYRLDPPAFEYVSPSWELITGMPAATVLADRDAAIGLIEPEDMTRLRRVMEEGTDPDHPEIIRVLRIDGIARHAEFQSTAIRDADGVITHTVGTGRDVTERVEAEQGRLESEARFREIADRSRDIIFRYRLRPDAGFAFLSQSAARLAGESGIAAFLGDADVLERTVHPDDRYLLASLLTSTVPTDDPVTIRWLNPDGEVTWVEVTVVPVLGTDGFPDAIDGVARVVTDRVVAQQALAHSEERFRLLAERSRDVILRYRVKPNPGLEWVSPSIEALTGYSPTVFVEHPEIVMSHFDPADMEPLQRAMLSGTPPGEPILVRWWPPGRPAATWEVSAVPVLDRAGDVVATESVARDVSVRVAAQRAVERSERQFREMLANLELLAIIVDAEGRCIFANPATARLAGAPPEALLGQDLVHLLAPPQFSSQARAYLAMLMAGMPGDRRDLIVAAADGTMHTLVWDAFVLHDDDGHPSALAAIGEDVTEARRAATDRDRLMAVMERSADALAIVDADGSVGYANPAMLDRMGSRAAAVVGLPAADVLPATLDIPWPMPEPDGGGPWHAERTSPAGRDAAIVEELMVTPISDGQGGVSHIVVELWDVSRVRELEWAVDRATGERAVVTAALRQLDNGASPEETAAAITGELRGLPGVDAASIVGFEVPSGGITLAAEGLGDVRVGDLVPEAAVVVIRERLASGPFIERWTELHPHNRSSQDGAPIRAIACAPLLVDGGQVGFLTLASIDPDQHRRFGEDLDGVAELGALTSALIGPAIRARRQLALGRMQIRRVIAEHRFEVWYQPVVEIATDRIIGFEAITRYLDATDPAVTTRAAAEAGLALELEQTLVDAAIEGARTLPADAWLGLDVTPELLGEPGSLADRVASSGRPVVLDLSEHHLIADYGPIRATLAALGAAVRLAIDDTGVGQANLGHLVELHPAFVKVDATIVHGVDSDVTRQAMARGILQFSAATGSTVIAEGVETPAELEALKRLGITVAQGPLLGLPAEAGSWAHPGTRTDATHS